MRKRILIIDDDLDLTISLQDLISGDGYLVSRAGDGKTGMEMQEANPFDMIITDIIMPEVDGLKVIITVRSKFPDTKLIAISGGGYISSRNYLLMAKELGASMVLCKPFDYALLRSEIKRLVG